MEGQFGQLLCVNTPQCARSTSKARREGQPRAAFSFEPRPRVPRVATRGVSLLMVLRYSAIFFVTKGSLLQPLNVFRILPEQTCFLPS